MRRISLWPVDLWLFLCTVGALIFVGLRGYDYYYISRANDLLRVYAWGRVPLQLLPAYDEKLVLALGLSSYVLWVIGLFGAMIKARDAAQRLGVAGHKWSGWAIASIIIPVVGWIVPWLVVGEIRRSIVSSARRSSFDDTWRTKSSFSAATLLVALCFLLNAGMAKVLSDINQNTTSAAGVASAVSDMPLGLTIIAACFAASLVYLLSTRAALGALARSYAESIG